MRRLLLPFVLASFLFLGTPTAQAAAKIEFPEVPAVIQFLDDAGERLDILGVGDPVTINVQLENSGNETFSGSVTLLYKIQSGDNAYNVTTPKAHAVSLDAGERTNVTFDWVPKVRGNHSIDVSNAADPGVVLHLAFRVEETPVRRGTLVDGVIQYAWFYTAFALVLVLFVAVLKLRPPPRS